MKLRNYVKRKEMQWKSYYAWMEQRRKGFAFCCCKEMRHTSWYDEKYNNKWKNTETNEDSTFWEKFFFFVLFFFQNKTIVMLHNLKTATYKSKFWQWKVGPSGHFCPMWWNNPGLLPQLLSINGTGVGIKRMNRSWNWHLNTKRKAEMNKTKSAFFF